MRLRSPFATVLLVAALGTALAGAGRLVATTSAERRFEANLARWKGYTEPQRDALRANWRGWLQRPVAQRTQIEGRFGVLSRLQRQLELSGDGEPTPDRLADELTRELEGLTSQVRREVPDAPRDISLAEAVDLLFHRRVEAFLDHVQARGRLTAEERARLLALPPAALADQSLLLLKAEHLALLPARLADELAGCDPRELSARIDDVVRRSGFLGRAGRRWPLSAEERVVLSALPTAAEVRGKLRQMRATAIRERLEGHPLTPAEVDQLLAAPWNELQRNLDQLLAGG